MFQRRKRLKQKIEQNIWRGVDNLALDINTILKTDGNYNKVFSTYYNKVRENFDVREAKLKVTYDDKEVTMKVSQFLVNLVLWKPFLYFGKRFKEDFIVETKNINADIISTYLDKVITEFLTEENQVELNECISDIIEELGWFSLDFNMIIGNTINLKDWVDLSKRNEKFNELIHRKFDESSMSTDEIETQMRQDTAEMTRILGEEDNVFQDYINAKEGVNKDQMTQFMINVGPKPDLKGNVYPKIVNTNFLIGGLESASDYFIDAAGGRKAAIINFGQVKKAGYTMRKLSLLCMNTLLDYQKKDCGTTNHMNVLVDSEKTLRRLNGRYFINKGKTKRITKESKELVGETIQLRSPITCADKKICRTCYGDLSKINNDIHVGILGIEILTSQLTQMLLSAKHLLKTNSEVINWSEDFQEFFTLDANAVIMNPALDNENRYSIVIEENSINENEEISEDIADEMDFNKSINNFKITFKEGGKNKVIKIDSEKELFMSPHFEELLKSKAVKDEEGRYTLGFKDLSAEEPLFFIEVENNELAKHLHNILNLIDNKEHLNVANKEEMLQKFIELLNESGIFLDAVHAENIVRELIRRTDDITKRPDFSGENPPYMMLRVSDAIMNSESIIISFAFEKIKKQLYEPETYRKTAPSFLDKLFN
jgi:hypothetical protein